MKPAIRRLAWVFLACTSVACVAALVNAFPPLWPLEVQQARQRWEQRGSRHYEVDVVWADGWNVGYARVEMRDGHFVAATDLDTGQPLDPTKQLSAEYFASVNQIFALVEERAWPSLDWRIVVSRFFPLLRRWLKPCIPPLNSVTFDQQLGYPREVFYNNSWCNRTTFFTYSRVQLSNLKLLR